MIQNANAGGNLRNVVVGDDIFDGGPATTADLQPPSDDVVGRNHNC